MSGPWAREADAVVCLGAWNLADASLWLADALNCGGAGRAIDLRTASAIIWRERKRLPESLRSDDWSETISDESLIWRALRFVTAVNYFSLTSTKAGSLREAEAALRTIHKRGRS